MSKERGGWRVEDRSQVRCVRRSVSGFREALSWGARQRKDSWLLVGIKFDE